MTRITDFVLRHKLIVAAFWLLTAGLGFTLIASTAGRLSADFALPGQPGYVADTQIEALYHNGGGKEPTVIVASAPGTISTTAAHKVFAAAAAAVPGSRLADGYTTSDAHFVTNHGRTEFALVFTPTSSGFGPDTITPLLTTAAAAAAPAGWHTGVTGIEQLSAGDSTQQQGTSTLTETLIGALGALLVLAFVFGSALALLPMVMATVAIPATFLLIDGLTYVTSVSMLVEFLVALIGLGIAIDYSLLVVTRWREARDNGAAPETAVREAMASAGRAVVFSGLTVAVSLLALLVVPVPFLRNMAVAGFFIPLVSIAVAVTLLPVLLASVGARFDRPRLRHEQHASAPWSTWARFVLAHRRTAALVGAGLLVALLVPLTQLRLGEPTTAALAQSGPAHQALADLTSGGTSNAADSAVPTGVLTPIEVLTRADAAPAVAQRLAAVPGVFTAVAPADFRRGGTAIVDVLPAAEPSSPQGRTSIEAVQATAGAIPGVIGVGGDGPTQQDFINAVYGSFPMMLALIALLSFVLLARAFRSIVLAAKAVLFNLLSVGAAYGVMVLVWQYGIGSQALWGIPTAGSVTVWVPIMVFAFLFGLSMDYEVFILSRMREEYDRTGSTECAVVTGLARTGRLVTCAALILFFNFVSMSTTPVTDVKVLATGLGAGIVLDAIVVRSLLVPALVGVLGRWNWWLPRWFARLLHVTPSPLPPKILATTWLASDPVATLAGEPAHPPRSVGVKG